jgi:Flp pilus assembly protein TadG
MIRKLLSLFWRREIGAGTSGSAAIEFAMVLPVLMALVAGSINYGLMGLQMSTLISAARGGAEYAKSNPTDSSLASNTGTVSTVTGAAGSSTTATLVCRCATTGTVTAANCAIGTGLGNPCSGNDRPIFSVQVRTTQNTLFSLGPFSFSSLSATTKIRFE